MEKKIQRLNNFYHNAIKWEQGTEINYLTSNSRSFHKEQFYLTEHFYFTNLLEVNKIQGLLTLGIQPPPRRKIANYLIPYWEVIRVSNLSSNNEF